MRFSERLAVMCGLALLVSTVAGPAQGTPSVPGAIQAHLTLAEAPPCTLCHLGAPGRGTVNTPFGATMRSRGLVAYDEAALGIALDALAAESKDSDGDGAGDIRELRDGTDPNAGAGGSEAPVPEYGCNAGARPEGGALLALLLAALIVGWRRRTKPARRSALAAWGDRRR
jgi:MYXO-CTERM domain-containing protein